MNIIQIANMRNKWEKFLEQYNNNKLDVVFYGAGAGSEWVLRLFATEHISPSMIIDKNLGGKYKNGIAIVHYDDFKRKYEDSKEFYIIITTPQYEEEILETLKKDFDKENSIFSFECEIYYSYIHDIPAYRTWLIENKAEFDKLYNILGDSLSRQTLENVLKGRISGELKYFRNVYVPDQYFARDLVQLSEKEIFVDVGAYTGDTVEQILDITNRNYSEIFCFEPDLDCCEILRKNTIQNENIHVISKGAWNKQEKLFIKSDPEHGASTIGEDGKYAVELDCIDNCIGEDIEITHIKMDIEGAELNALKGCERHIKNYRPKLAICIYHRNEDFLDIPKYILSIVPEYKLYIRHHNISGTETVLYAIP